MGRVDAILTSPRQALGEGHQRLRSTWSPQGREAGRIALPQATECTAQAVERGAHPAQVPARAMTEMAQEPAPQRLIARLQQVQEKGIGQRRQGQELLALLPTPQPRTLKGQFAFVKAPGQLDLPSAHIHKHDVPGIFIGRDRLSGQQIPGSASEARGRPPAREATRDARDATLAAPGHWL